MSVEKCAENEVRLACERERRMCIKAEKAEYGVGCYESALKAFKCLMDDGHSGFSIGITRNILDRLIKCQPLTPIEDVPDIWNKIGIDMGYIMYQCSRMPSLFKYVYQDGTVRYDDIDRFVCATIDNEDTFYYNKIVRDVMDEMFPITMPYWPTKEFKVYTEEFLVDPKNGDYDTIGILYAIDPNDERVEINRYFAEKGGQMVEIDREEYITRKAAVKYD